MSLVAKRLDEALRRAPKTGYKASMYTGIVSKLASMAKTALRAAELAECIGKARNECRKSGGAAMCSTGCAGIYLVESGGSKSLLKIGSNSLGVKIDEDRIEIKSKKAGIVLEPGRISILLPSGSGWEEFRVDVSEVDDVIKNYYFIKYTIQRVDWSLNVILRDLASCSRRSGITC